MVDKRLQLCLGCIGYQRVVGNVFGRCLEAIRRVGVAQRMYGELPIPGAVGAFGQLAAQRVGQAQLDAHGLVHPVVGGELGSERGNRLGVRAVVAIVFPGHCLHVGTQVAKVLREVNTQKLAVRTRCLFDGSAHARKVRRLKRLARNTGIASSCSLREREGIAIFRDGFQAVGSRGYLSRFAVRLQLALAITAGQRAAVLNEAVRRLERVQVGSLHLHRHVLQTRDLVVLHGVIHAVAGHVAAVPRHGLAIGGGEGLAVSGPGCQLELGALVGLNGGHALVAATVQAVVGGGAGHRVERAFVRLVTRVEQIAGSGGIARLHAFGRPVLGPGQASVAVGIALKRVHRSLQVFHLLRRLGFAKLVFAQKRFGLVAFDNELLPRFSGVIVLVQRSSLVISSLQRRLRLLRYRRNGFLDVVSRCLKVVRGIGVTKRMDSNGPITGAVGSLGELATRRIRQAKLDADFTMHPVIGLELRAIRGNHFAACCVITVIRPGHRLHVRAKLAITGALEVNAHHFAELSQLVGFVHLGTQIVQVNRLELLALQAGLCACLRLSERENVT